MSPPRTPSAARSPGAVILLRRGCTIGCVVARRTAAAGWHAAIARVSHRDLDEAQTFRSELRHILEDLGPTFVKLGQLLSARADVIRRGCNTNWCGPKPTTASKPRT
jgi:predicted unusual protein kinase regulating ubiquinone biosynthesis (AarF/ABC1/UbiB family)